MDELLPDCAPEGTATPVYSARIVRLTRRARVQRWVARLLGTARRGGKAVPSPSLPPPAAGEGDGEWMNLSFLERDSSTQRGPRVVRRARRPQPTPAG
jgi:hypothetical protein